MNANSKKRYKDIDFPFTCPITNRTFNSSKGLSVYVTKTLKMNHEDYYNDYINHRDSSCFFCGGKGKFISVSKGYRNLCDDPECVKKSFSSHSVEGFMYRKICSREEAEKLFIIENDRQLKERIKSQGVLRGEDPLWDKKRCRNCKEFWIEKGLSVEDAEIKSEKSIREFIKKSAQTIKSNPEKYADKFPTKIEYYLKRGFTEVEGRKKISEIQNRFSLEKCVEKHGNEEGEKVWLDRQERWINTLNLKTEEEKIEINKKKLDGAQYSPISQRLFWDIYNLVGNDKTKFAEQKKEFYLLSENKKWFAYDYVDMLRKKCIEFNGDFWHCNPNFFNSGDIHRVKNKKASEIWKIDEDKINLIKNKGYEILIIWESDYRKNPEATLEKCINFLNNEK